MFENIEFKSRFLLYVYVLDNVCTGTKRVRLLTRFFVPSYELALKEAQKYIESYNFVCPIIGWEVRPFCFGVESPKTAIRRQQSGTAWRTMNYSKRRPKAVGAPKMSNPEEEESTGDCLYNENDLAIGIK